MSSQVKLYRNKNIGHFHSIPISLIDKSSILDTLYLASHFKKLANKPVATVRASKHYVSTVDAWQNKLTGVDTTDLAAVAGTLGLNVEVFNPLASSSEPRALVSGGGRSSKRKAQLLKVKKEVYKPMRAGAIIDELPPDMMRDVVARLDPEDKSALLGVSRGVREDTIAALPPQTILSRAVDTGNVELLEIAIKEGADVNAKTHSDRTPLHKSAENGHLEIVQALIEAGADVKAKTDYGEPPLHFGAKTDYGYTPLHSSARMKHLEVSRALIEAGADVNAKADDGNTPLHVSAVIGHLDVTQVFIEAGADVNAKDKWGQTPLYQSAGNGHLEIARYLIEEGADVNARTASGYTPLHFSARNRHLEVARALIEAGADVNANHNDGWTPLHWSARNEHLEIAQALIEKGADVEAKQIDGWTPLHWSAYGRLKVARALIEAGANVNAKTNDGETPLHKSAEYGHLEVARLLIDNGADVNAKKDDGETPLHGSALNGRLEVSRALIEAGADLHIENDWGKTPLDKDPRLAEFQRNVRRRTGGADKPLTWENWTVTLPGATDIALTDQKVSEIVGDSINLTKMFADNARRGIKRGMENFFKNAQWFEVETDLKIIAKRLGHSERFLQSYMVQKQCYQQSYLFSIADNRCFTIHGWATDIKLKFPTSHTCLCAVLDDGLFVFDLVRDEPLLMFGAPVRRDFMERIEDIGSHGGLYAIDTMNYLNHQQSYRDNPDDLDKLLKVLRAKRVSEKKKEQEELSEEDYSDYSDAKDESESEDKGSRKTRSREKSEYDSDRSLRPRVGGRAATLDFNTQSRRSSYGQLTTNDAELAEAIQVLFSKIKTMRIKRDLALRLTEKK